MDDYKTPGNYYCENYTTANTIKNNPFPNTPFILKVEFNTGQNYPIQTFTKFEGKVIAKRILPYNINGTLKVRTREAGTWRDWRTP